MCNKRQQFLQNKYAIQLTDLSNSTGQNESDFIDNVFKTLCSTDPTPNNRYLEWLLTRYLENPQELKEAKQTYHDKLCEFEAIKKKTKGLDINHLTTLNSLVNVVSLLRYSTRSVSKKTISIPTINEALANRDIVLMSQTNQMTIYKIETFNGAKVFSSVTNWCNSKNYRFFNWFSDDLYVFETHGYHLYQLHMRTGELRANHNTPISPQQLTNQYPEIWQTLSNKLLDYDLLCFIPEPLPKDICLETIKDKLMETDQVTIDVGELPPALTHYQFLYFLLINSKTNFRTIPDKLKDKQLCELAVKNDRLNIRWVPDHINLYSVYQNYIKLGDELTLTMIAELPQYHDLVLATLKKNGLLLSHICPTYRNMRFYDVAILSNGLALQFVPEDRIDKLLCFNAINNNPMAIAYAPACHLDINLVLQAVTNSQGEAVKFIPDKYIGLGYEEIDSPAEYYGLLVKRKQ